MYRRINYRECYEKNQGLKYHFTLYKPGLLEITSIQVETEVWFDPEKRLYSSEYRDALLLTRSVLSRLFMIIFTVSGIWFLTLTFIIFIMPAW